LVRLRNYKRNLFDTAVERNAVLAHSAPETIQPRGFSQIRCGSSAPPAILVGFME